MKKLIKRCYLRLLQNIYLYYKLVVNKYYNYKAKEIEKKFSKQYLNKLYGDTVKLRYVRRKKNMVNKKLIKLKLLELFDDLENEMFSMKKVTRMCNIAITQEIYSNGKYISLNDIEEIDNDFYTIEYELFYNSVINENDTIRIAFIVFNVDTKNNNVTYTIFTSDGNKVDFNYNDSKLSYVKMIDYIAEYIYNNKIIF